MRLGSNNRLGCPNSFCKVQWGPSIGLQSLYSRHPSGKDSSDLHQVGFCAFEEGSIDGAAEAEDVAAVVGDLEGS
jgi:hypothetical protein